MHLVAAHGGLRDVARRLKPQIPLIGNYGIPIRDEMELEMLVSSPGPRARKKPAEEVAR